jgi:hypothetical protein
MLPLDISSLRPVLSPRFIALIVVAQGVVLSPLLVVSADTVFLYSLYSSFPSLPPSSHSTLVERRIDATSEEMAAHVELFSRLIMEAKLVGIGYTSQELAAMFVGTILG